MLLTDRDEYMHKLLKIFFTLCLSLFICICLQITSYAIFYVPTNSMQPAVLSGEYIWVNKWIFGARVFKAFKPEEDKDVRIYRIPGLRNIHRNDILVFNYPYSGDRGLSFNFHKYNVKRCIALPGDTLEIINGFYKVYGTDEMLGDMEAQERIKSVNEQKTEKTIMKTFPWDDYINWNILNWGPLYIPAKNKTVIMDSTAVKLYGALIEWEQKKMLTCTNNIVLMGDSLINEYRFKENYYFVSGDNMEHSKDSRYWGLLPESYIVGVATRIWKSVSPNDGSLNWGRIWKKIK